MDFIFIALWNGTPIASAHTMEELEVSLDEYTGANIGLSNRLRYVAYNSKYPSINDYEGSYYYLDNNEINEDEFKIYCTGYRKESK